MNDRLESVVMIVLFTIMFGSLTAFLAGVSTLIWIAVRQAL